MTDPTKRCPYCAEEILAAAIKCKHCGTDLVPAVASAPPPTQPAAKQPSGATFPQALGCGLLCAMIAVGGFIWYAVASGTDKPGAAVAASTPTSVSVGEHGFLRSPSGKRVPCYDTQDSYDASIKAAVAHDDVGFQLAYIASTPVQQGTEVLVIGFGRMLSYAKQVRVVSGEDAGKACWVSSERIARE